MARCGSATCAADDRLVANRYQLPVRGFILCGAPANKLKPRIFLLHRKIAPDQKLRLVWDLVWGSFLERQCRHIFWRPPSGRALGAWCPEPFNRSLVLSSRAQASPPIRPIPQVKGDHPAIRAIRLRTMGALPNVASSRRYHRIDWRIEKREQGAKLGLDGRDRITEGIVTRPGGDATG
jgi:hypothetical protein